MTATMRAKMRVASVTRFPNPAESLQMHAVGRNDAYPEDGSDEDNTYAKFTPQAELNILIMNPALHGKFKPGDELYVDFTRAGPADASVEADGENAA